MIIHVKKLKFCYAFRVSPSWEWLEIWCGNFLIIIAVPFGSQKANGSAATKL